jgi:hypothetical protein
MNIRHFHGTSFDSRTVSDVQVVECLINLLSKFVTSLPSASSASPEQSSGTPAALADLCWARSHMRPKIGIVRTAVIER